MKTDHRTERGIPIPRDGFTAEVAGSESRAPDAPSFACWRLGRRGERKKKNTLGKILPKMTESSLYESSAPQPSQGSGAMRTSRPTYVSPCTRTLRRRTNG